MGMRLSGWSGQWSFVKRLPVPSRFLTPTRACTKASWELLREPVKQEVKTLWHECT